MSTFAVFGMTMDLALAEARKVTGTKRANPKTGEPPIELSPEDWMHKVRQKADQIMGSAKCKQLSPAFDAPQFAEQFVELARKSSKCRDLRIRAKQVLKDEKGIPLTNKKTKAPKTGWLDWLPERKSEVA